MQKIEYDLPIFEDTDKADLNEYSIRMATALKEQIDKFGNPLIFRGAVQTLADLQALANIQSGYIYRVDDENKNYIYNGTEWIVYSDNVDLSKYQEEVNTQINECQSEVNNQIESYQNEVNSEINNINEAINNKVDKVEGKGLSTNDYTTTEKNKLAGIATSANKTTVNNTLTSTSTTEALSAAQGKALNDKIANLKSKVLYDNSSGTSGTITLSESAANFSYLEIFFKDNANNKCYSAKLQSPNGKSTSLSYIEPFDQSHQNTASFYLFGRQITINATSISTDTGHYGLVNISGSTVLYQNRFNITKVLGYR